MLSTSGFVDDVIFSHNGAHTVARRQWSSTSDPSPPTWAISTRPQLAANDFVVWRGEAIYDQISIMWWKFGENRSSASWNGFAQMFNYGVITGQGRNLPSTTASFTYMVHRVLSTVNCLMLSIQYGRVIRSGNGLYRTAHITRASCGNNRSATANRKVDD